MSVMVSDVSQPTDPEVGVVVDEGERHDGDDEVDREDAQESLPQVAAQRGRLGRPARARASHGRDNRKPESTKKIATPTSIRATQAAPAAPYSVYAAA